MINYRELCETAIAKPPFSKTKIERVLFELTRMEIEAYKKHEEVYYADNDKWYEVWLAMKEAVLDYRHIYYMIGSKQFVTLVSPIKHQIIGRTQ